MSRKTMIMALGTAFLLLAGVVISLVLHNSNEPDVRYFPEQLEFRIELRDGEDLRVVQYYPDGLTPKHAKADHVDGKLSDYWFYETGNMKEARTQSAEIDGARQILRHSLIAPDGVTYESDTKYNLDGIKTEESILVSDSVTDRKFFFDSTGDLHKHQTIEKKEKVGWVKTAELVYAETGYLYSQFAMAEDGSTSTTVFTESKKIAARFNMSKYGSQYEEKWYYDDEKTVHRHVEQTNNGTNLRIYRKDGTLSARFYWAGFIDKTGMLIHEAHNEAGTIVFEQSWGFHGDRYYIWSVSVNREDGKDHRSIYFSNRSPVPTSETIYDLNDPRVKDRVLNYFDENALLEKRREFKDGKWLEDEYFKPEDGITITFPEEWLNFPSYEAPPQAIPYRPSRGPGGR